MTPLLRAALLGALLVLTGCPIGFADGDEPQPGPRGERGERGPQGLQGPPGVVDTAHVLYDFVYVHEGLHETVTVFCPEDSIALSGGASMASVSIPAVEDGRPVGWTCGGDAWDEPVLVGCYVVCTGAPEDG